MNTCLSTAALLVRSGSEIHSILVEAREKRRDATLSEKREPGRNTTTLFGSGECAVVFDIAHIYARLEHRRYSSQKSTTFGDGYGAKQCYAKEIMFSSGFNNKCKPDRLLMLNLTFPVI